MKKIERGRERERGIESEREGRNWMEMQHNNGFW